ncbi:sensor histidine kinase [Microbacterium aerolatum]|uniref:histidine kinase n=1 Tax=Microbacterium aerolatum TaxID=153731 RepID=A0A511ACP7_9MICO|nr:sensor histidine kinase [Microbacterium aerolatum]GEK85776.1 two-component sensor histidine kinase [Microbacterium aerolatum]GGB20427.1 two-component sensor histidine kinase [Microbacterium aerolatum]
MSATSRTLTPRQRQADVLLAVVVFLTGVISAALSAISEIYGDEQAPLWQALVYLAVISAPLAFRRAWPAPVAVVVSVAYFVSVTLHLPEIYAGNIAVFISLYTMGAWMANRRAAMLVRVAIIAGMFIWLLVTMYRDAIDTAREEDIIAGAMSPYLAFMLLNLLINVLYFAGAYYFGEHAWKSAMQRQALEQRTADLEREREVTAAQAVALDRVRIARELHDVVAHHVSVMGVQAGAARMVIDQDAATSKELLGGIETSAREAISELRHLLETLRSSGAEGEEAPSTVGLDDIAALVDASNAAGLPTEFSVVGDERPVPSVVQVNLYRIAQESLTNARRHAGTAATADVRLRYTDDDVELEVVNTGRRVLAPRPGMGQLGMRERVLASGGTLESAPREQGGWRVRAQVPLRESADLAGAIA